MLQECVDVKLIVVLESMKLVFPIGLLSCFHTEILFSSVILYQQVGIDFWPIDNKIQDLIVSVDLVLTEWKRLSTASTTLSYTSTSIERYN